MQKGSNGWPALIIGLGIAVFSLPIVNNISSDILFSDKGFSFIVLASWLIIISVAAVTCVYITEVIGRRKPIVFQITKYGLVGWLNVFIYAGIFNLFSWFFGIASGWIADIFLLAAFVATTINGFFWNKFWTFDSRYENKREEYIKFFSVTSITSLLRILLFHLVVNNVGAPVGISEQVWANIAIFALIPVSFLGNFFGYRFFVFKKKIKFSDLKRG